MKYATVLVAAATVVLAKPQHGLPPGSKIDCAKPNANYCMGGDIILRCDGSAVGTPGRCSDNVAGYPPAGGVAECYESSKEAGDAACQKNCVVYAAESSFTLPADKCTPSATQTGSKPPSTETGTAPSTSAPGTTTAPGTTETSAPPTTQSSTETGIASIPEGTSMPTSVGTVSAPPTNETTVFTNPIRSTIPVARGTSTEEEGCPGPTGTGGEPPAGTNAASSNKAMGGLAVAGVIAAYLL